MRVPSQLLIVLFAILAVVDAHVIPKRGKYLSFVADLSFGLTTALLVDDGYPGGDNLVGGY